MPGTADPIAADQLRTLDERLRRAVDEVLRGFLAQRRTELERLGPEAAGLVTMLEQFLQGGKLLRPRFCFWGGLTAGADAPSDAQLDALARCGAAIELVQAAALIHDDVIDHSPVRRGRPSVHIAAATDHEEQALRGDAADHGVAVAIILGDLALSWAEQLAAEVEAEGADALRRARHEFDLLRTEVMGGQFLDILHQAGGFLSAPDAEDAARAVIRWKTVPYTVDRPLRMGAALLGADDDLLESLSAWALEVGTAFQLRDDLLSVVGDVDTTGKPTGGDLLEGKRTVLLARTTQAADPSQRALLDRTVGRPGAEPADVRAVHHLMHTSGAMDTVREDIRAHAERAQHLLEGMTTASALGRAGLAALARAATDVEALPTPRV